MRKQEPDSNELRLITAESLFGRDRIYPVPDPGYMLEDEFPLD